MSATTRRDLLIVACAVSAGVHAALAPGHFHESFAEGAGFVAATVLLVAIVAALALRPASRKVAVVAAIVFGGLLVSYVLAATTGIPLLHPDGEPVDGIAIDTKLVELAGLALAALMLAGGHHHA